MSNLKNNSKFLTNFYLKKNNKNTPMTKADIYKTPRHSISVAAALKSKKSDKNILKVFIWVSLIMLVILAYYCNLLSYLKEWFNTPATINPIQTDTRLAVIPSHEIANIPVITTLNQSIQLALETCLDPPTEQSVLAIEQEFTSLNSNPFQSEYNNLLQYSNSSSPLPVHALFTTLSQGTCNSFNTNITGHRLHPSAGSLIKLIEECADANSMQDQVKKITEIFDLIDIKNNSEKDEFLKILNSNNGLKNIEIENLRDFNTFKITKDQKSYVLKQLGYSRNSWINTADLRAEKVDSPNIAKILHVFERNTDPKAGDIPNKDVWYLTDYLEISWNSPIVKKGGIKMMKSIGIDILNGLKDLHKNNIIHGNVNLSNIGGTVENGKIVFKLFNLSDSNESEDLERFGYMKFWDIKNFGRMLHEWNNSFNSRNQKMITVNDIKGVREFPFIPNNVPLMDLILLCQGLSTNKPKTIDDLLNHPFFTGNPLKLSNDQYGERLYNVSDFPN